MFVVITFPAGTLVTIDRDAVEDALTAALCKAGLGEITGAGMVLEGGANLDVELSRATAGLSCIRGVLRELQVSHDVRLRVNGASLTVYGDDPAPRAKRKPKTWQASIGDVFEITLPDGRYSYGRVTPQRDLYELFVIVRAERVSVDALRTVSSVRPATFFNLERVQWPVIGNIPYDSYEPQQYRIAYAPVELTRSDDGFLDTGNIIPERILTTAELPNFSTIAIGGPETLISYLDRLVAGGGG